MKLRKLKTRSGFTMIELLIVMAVISLLLSILIPGGARVRDLARKQKALSNARQIALAYNLFAQSGPRTKTISRATFVDADTTKAENINDFAAIVANLADLDIPALYICDGDPAASLSFADLPDSILNGTAIDTTFEKAAGDAKSWQCAFGLDSSFGTPANLPLIWSRGLLATGLWPAAAATLTGSVWGADGGHVAFLDSHVEWMNTFSVNGEVNIEDVVPGTAGVAGTGNIGAAGTTSPTP